jgi:hypothetical protein
MHLENTAECPSCECRDTQDFTATKERTPDLLVQSWWAALQEAPRSLLNKTAKSSQPKHESHAIGEEQPEGSD